MFVSSLFCPIEVNVNGFAGPVCSLSVPDQTTIAELYQLVSTETGKNRNLINLIDVITTLEPESPDPIQSLLADLPHSDTPILTLALTQNQPDCELNIIVKYTDYIHYVLKIIPDDLEFKFSSPAYVKLDEGNNRLARILPKIINAQTSQFKETKFSIHSEFVSNQFSSDEIQKRFWFSRGLNKLHKLSPAYAEDLKYLKCIGHIGYEVESIQALNTWTDMHASSPNFDINPKFDHLLSDLEPPVVDFII